MEAWMDDAETALPPLRAFILPGGSNGAAELHLCRTVCRRAERTLLPLLREGVAEVEPGVTFALRYLNRLSDLLFVLARLENVRTGVTEIEWVKENG
jgi:cob(I)alamin adenosyltransferase